MKENLQIEIIVGVVAIIIIAFIYGNVYTFFPFQEVLTVHPNNISVTLYVQENWHILYFTKSNCITGGYYESAFGERVYLNDTPSSNNSSPNNISLSKSVNELNKEYGTNYQTC